MTWNLVEGEPGEFVVTDIDADRLVSSGFLADQRFVTAHARGEKPFTGTVIDDADFIGGGVPHGPRHAERGLLRPREAPIEHRHGRAGSHGPRPRRLAEAYQGPNG